MQCSAKYLVRLTKKNFYSGDFSSIQGPINADSDNEARKEAWELATRTELRLSASVIEKVEVQINGKWEEVTGHSFADKQSGDAEK